MDSSPSPGRLLPISTRLDKTKDDNGKEHVASFARRATLPVIIHQLCLPNILSNKFQCCQGVDLVKSAVPQCVHNHNACSRVLAGERCQSLTQWKHGLVRNVPR